MRISASLLVCAALLLAPRAHADENRVELGAFESVHGIRIADADGDGVQDVLLLEGRRLIVFSGRTGRLPAAKPSGVTILPETVSFVDVVPHALLTIGTEGAERIPLAGSATRHAVKGGAPTSWRDDERVAFVRLAQPGGGLLVPSRGGWLYRPGSGGAAIRLASVPSWTVRPPGPFLEDTCDVTIAWPTVYVGQGAIWALAGRDLVAQSSERQVTYDLSFLRADTPGQSVEQRLIDLDGDARPELVHRIYNNREARYGFFRTRPVPKPTDTRGPSHKPAASDLYLSGFPLDPEFVDLDRDGLKDVVLTSIEIDAANTLRALGSGKVTAKTHAFLNRWREGRGRYFRNEADVVVKSDIGVKVRFNYAGTIEVERSFTILVDGDYDGDGRKDLAIRTGDRTLTIRRWVTDGVWEKKGTKFAIPPLRGHPDVDGHVGDLDGDGRDEIVLHYRKPPGGRDRIHVLRPLP